MTKLLGMMEVMTSCTDWQTNLLTESISGKPMNVPGKESLPEH
jgi:hypothetical protein